MVQCIEARTCCLGCHGGFMNSFMRKARQFYLETLVSLRYSQSRYPIRMDWRYLVSHTIQFKLLTLLCGYFPLANRPIGITCDGNHSIGAEFEIRWSD